MGKELFLNMVYVLAVADNFWQMAVDAAPRAGIRQEKGGFAGNGFASRLIAGIFMARFVG